MTVWRGFVITVCSGLGFGVAGGALGFAIGKLAPDYYRVVFHIHPDAPLDPVQAGVGLGLTQGMGVGIAVGLVTVLAVAWHTSRRGRSSAKPVRRDHRPS